MIVHLDELSKDVGLFPQSNKIDIHSVVNIEQELKSISNPLERVVQARNVIQDRLHKRISHFIHRSKISNETRFKHLLAYAKPRASLNAKLLRIAESRPDLMPVFARYFGRYKRLPQKVVSVFVASIGPYALFPSLSAIAVRLLDGRTPNTKRSSVFRAIKKLWNYPTSAELKGVVGEYLIKVGGLTPQQVKYAADKNRSWWVRLHLTSAINCKAIGRAAVETIVNERLRDKNDDVALAAAEKIFLDSLAVQKPYKDINPRAGKVLRSLGIINRQSNICGIEKSFERLLGKHKNPNWRRIFGSDYGTIEQRAVHIRALADTDVTAFVNGLDVFNDWLLWKLFAHDRAIGTYRLGKFGGALQNSRFKAAYPQTHALISTIHEKRYISALSHPRVARTGRPTRRIPYSFLRTAKRLMRSAFSEIARQW